MISPLSRLAIVELKLEHFKHLKRKLSKYLSVAFRQDAADDHTAIYKLIALLETELDEASVTERALKKEQKALLKKPSVIKHSKPSRHRTMDL